jgi:hypothetical protein
MIERCRTKEQAVEIAVAFLKARGLAYHKLGDAVYVSRERLDWIANTLRDEFITSDPPRLDPATREEFLRQLDDIRASQRPHWSVEVICYPMSDDLNPEVIIYDDSDEPVLE